MADPNQSTHDNAGTKRLHAEHDITKLRVMQSEGDSMAAKYAMSVGAASIAEAVTYPLDLTKTRLQLQGEVAAGDGNIHYRGMFRTAFGIAKEEVLFDLNNPTSTTT
jgi:hypothetical protein